MDAWLDSSDFTDSTRRIYTRAARSWLLKAQPWGDNWRTKSVLWKKGLSDLALRSQCVFLAAARSFANWLIEENVLEGKNPFDSMRVKGLHASMANRRALTNEEVKRLLDFCDSGTDVGMRDRAALMIMLHMALRIGSVVAVDIEDIEQHGEYVVLKHRGKGQAAKAFSKTFPPNVLASVNEYLDATERSFGQAGPLFLADGGKKRISIDGLRKSIVRKLVCCKIKDPMVCVHSLRHTAATRAIDSGSDMRAVQGLLDHSSIATTDRYVHSVRQEGDGAELRISYEE